MGRRIVLTVLALMTALLAVVAIPLGLLTSAQDRRDFQNQTTAMAATLASVAEERIDDGSAGPALDRSIAELARQGDQVVVYNAAGRKIAGSGGGPPGAGRLASGAPAATVRSYPAEDGLLVLAPIAPGRRASPAGTVALTRSTESVDHRIATMWALIAAVAAAGLVIAAAIAVALARWASRPMTVLAEAARQLGGGALGTRAQLTSGPPEVRRLAATFNTMASRLQSLVHSHQSIMADVSHQVRTPLAALRLRLDLLAQDADETTAAELAGAQEEIARLARLVSGLLAVARAENVTAPAGPVDVGAIVRDRAAAWRPAAEERGVTLTAECPAPVQARLCDGHLEQILDNLLANGLDALPEGGVIRVAAQATAGLAQIAVADNGRGMTGQQQRAAFRRFSTGTPGGTGLGLAIVDRLVVANGGSAALSDTPGGGLTITIELPVARTYRYSRRPGAMSSGGRS